MQNNDHMIYPCQFSKGYGIPAAQAWVLINIFFIYRIVLASLFLILYFSGMGPVMLGSVDVGLYVASSIVYLLLSFVAGINIYFRYPSYSHQAQWLIFSDIVFITLLMHASGGVITGIGMLLVVSTAAGGLLIGGLCAMVFAAIATVAILSDQIYCHLQLHHETSYTYTGLLGISFFVIAFLAYFLARRTEQSERLTLQQKQTISKLQELNHYIIQHLQSGILIIDSRQQISMANQAALQLLKIVELPNKIQDISVQFTESFKQWQLDPNMNSVNLKLSDASELQVQFNPLLILEDSMCMVILEDVNLNNQRLQQGKLASLGRLTASIAHEIRNPLGAISHAGQLLSEAPALEPQDQRLTEIIATHSARINKIIDDILQLSKRKTSQRQRIELVSWLMDYRAQFITDRHLTEQQFKLQTNSPAIHVLFDQDHLTQIMDNLCLNALKYGGNHSFLVQTSFDLPTQCHYLDVIDQGPGISAENSKHLFEPFFTTSTSGTGLGLYISNELAELNQAKLSYHSPKNKGSCFCLSILDAENPKIEI